MEMKNETAAIDARVTSNDNKLVEVTAQNSAFSRRLTNTDRHVQLVKRNCSAQASKLSLVETKMAEIKAQDVELTEMDSRMDESENKTAVLDERLAVIQSQVDELRKENKDMMVQISNSSDRLLKDLKNAEGHTADLGAAVTDRLDTAEAYTEALDIRLNQSFSLLERLAERTSDRLKVAFTAGLTDSGSVGPFDEETTLVYSKILTNVGQAYNQTTGVFTAPVSGVYYFRYTVTDYLKGYMGVYLYRNEQKLLFNLQLNDHGGYAATSNGVSLQLDEGDTVRVGLPGSYRLYDDARNFSFFSGFLLFPL